MKELLLFLISLALYFGAPDNYSWLFCAVCTTVFIVGAVFSIKPSVGKKQFLSFNLIFLFSYFWTSFAYPLFIYGTFRDRANIINRYINWENLSHTSALALVFICAYFLGYVDKRGIDIYTSNSRFGSALLNVPNGLFIFISTMYVGNALFSFFSTGSVNLATGKFLTDIFFTLFVFVTYANVNNHHNDERSLKTFLIINKLPISFASFVFLFSIIIGDRGPAIKIVLVLFSVYYLFWNKVKLTKITLLSLLFLCLLFFVRQTRAGEGSLASGNISSSQIENTFKMENGSLYMFADLFYISRELNLGYEYAQKRELFHPEKILLVPLHPIPILPSAVSQLFFGKTLAQMDTGAELNSSVWNSYDVETHFGNHPAGDLLMSFGLIGLIIISYLFGEIVSFFERSKYGNLYTACGWITLMSWSLYLSRASILSIVRPLGYVYVLGFLVFGVSTKISKFRIKMEKY